MFRLNKKFWTPILSLFIGLTGLYAYAPFFIIEIKNPVIIQVKNLVSEHKNELQPKNQDFENISFFSLDSLKLNARIYYTDKKQSKGILILLHGIRSSKESFYPIIDFINRNHFHAIALDLRAHGSSEGKFCTYGAREKEDVKNLIDFLRNKKHLKGKIGIWGHSLGGAIAIQSLATYPEINFGIIESTYSDFDKITRDYARYYLGFSPDFLQENLIQRSGIIADFNPKKINPIDYCKKINQPVLFIHGTSDAKINIKYARENYKVLPTKEKYFIAVKNADHNNVWKIGGIRLFKKIATFLDEQ